jgi:hypothetical protein
MFVCAACGSGVKDATGAPPLAETGLGARIVGGTASTSAQDAVVFLNLGQGACAGLVLTLLCSRSRSRSRS